MALYNLLTTPSILSLVASSIAIISFVAWWIIRKRDVRIWLPTLRILELETKRLPRITLKKPFLIPFLCFVVAAAALVFLTFRPRATVSSPEGPGIARIHLFVDLSPSVAAQTTVEEIITKVTDIFDSSGNSKVTLGTSSSEEVKILEKREEIAPWLRNFFFHHPGLRLGTALKRQLDLAGKIDRLFIFSDRDEFSWNGFQWKYLADDMEVLHVDLSQVDRKIPRNFYISRVRYLSSPSSDTLDWEIEISSSSQLDQAVRGNLHANYRDQQLYSTPWSIEKGQQRTTISASWAATKSAIAAEKMEKTDPLIWTISDFESDLITMDNEYRTSMRGPKLTAAIIGNYPGEMILDDPAFPIRAALDSLGLQVTRFETGALPEFNLNDYRLWVLLGGAGLKQSNFCAPTFKSVPGEKSKKLSDSGKPDKGGWQEFWLAPSSLEVDYPELCECYFRILIAKGDNEMTPSYCTQITDQSTWVGLLSSLGAKQLGGEIEDAKQSLAWIGTNQETKRRVLAFAVPPIPDLGFINHAALPLILREILAHQGIIFPRGESQIDSSDNWQPILDVTSLFLNRQISTESMPVDLDSSLLTTNVPIQESRLIQTPDRDLPPQWSPQIQSTTAASPQKKEDQDPFPWIKLIAIIIIVATAVESVGTGIWKLSKKAAHIIFFSLFVFPGFQKSLAQVAVITTSLQSPLTIHKVAKDVSLRTSLIVADSIQNFVPGDRKIYSQPWIWLPTDDLSKLMADREMFATWIRRGGFVILLGNLSEAQALELSQMIDGNRKHNWTPIPPDHELMRSFYLLDSLPTCHSQGWKGFQIDNRIAIVSIPFDILKSLADTRLPTSCPEILDDERALRVFINVLMVATATDYKKDQIHLPEILKRLR